MDGQRRGALRAGGVSGWRGWYVVLKSTQCVTEGRTPRGRLDGARGKPLEPRQVQERDGVTGRPPQFEAEKRGHGVQDPLETYPKEQERCRHPRWEKECPMPEGQGRR